MQLPEKELITENWWPQILTWFWVIFLASWGGFVSFLAKVKRGDARAFNFAELMGEICISAFAGLMTFLFCHAANIDIYLTAAFVGISGHMGSRAIFKMEKWAENKFTTFDPNKKAKNDAE